MSSLEVFQIQHVPMFSCPQNVKTTFLLSERSPRAKIRKEKVPEFACGFKYHIVVISIETWFFPKRNGMGLCFGACQFQTPSRSQGGLRLTDVEIVQQLERQLEL